MSITQSTTNGIVDWCSFSIGAGRTVKFDNGTGATLNRVTGNEMSVLNGRLTGTGSVYLINPQGVLVGPNGVVRTGGSFVASTLDVNTNSFMQGGLENFSGTSNGTVINLGKISSTGGDVFLIANKAVDNLGTIKAPNGNVELDAGTEISVDETSPDRKVTVLLGNGGQALNAGTIRAAQISLEAADGNVYALAGNHSVLRATGTATRDGHVWLVDEDSDIDSPNAPVNHGVVDAQNAKITVTNADPDGIGGTVDMEGPTLNFAGVKVTAAQWNVTAPAFAINASNASTFSRNLSRGTSVAVDTSGVDGASGDIDVARGISWNGAATLALNANHSISLAPGVTIANKGSGNLTLHADSGAADNGGSVTNLGTIDWSKSTGTVAALYDMNGTYTPGTIDSNSTWSAAPFSGLLTQVTVYQLINSIADLNLVENNLAGVYALGANLNAKNVSGAVTEFGASTDAPFTGQFDGMGHSIENLNLANFSTGENALGSGLFALIGKTGVVRNLDVSANAVAGSAAVGVLAAENDGLVTHVNTNGTVSTDAEPGGPSGGIVGINRGTIEQSSSMANVSGDSVIGGAIGENYGTLVQSYASGTLSGGSISIVGGLVGINSGTVNESYSTGVVMGDGYNGGLVGQNAGTIDQSYAAASQPVFLTPNPPGGIAGNNQAIIASDVYWNTDTSQAASGVGSGNAVPASSGLTTAQMSNPASFGSTWDFSATGVWALPAGATQPVLRWQLAQP